MYDAPLATMRSETAHGTRGPHYFRFAMDSRFASLASTVSTKFDSVLFSPLANA